MHKSCIFAFFLPLLKKSLRDEAEILHEAYGKVVDSKSVKMVFVPSIIRHRYDRLCMIYAFFNFFAKNHFGPKIMFVLLRFYDYQESIAYLSCCIFGRNEQDNFHR